MEETIVRLQSLELNHIKNVKKGRIDMPSAAKKSLQYKEAEILGLYGQNGSGKTAVIDALSFLQKILMGMSLDKRMADYIDAREQEAGIEASFAIFTQEAVYNVVYKVMFKRTDGNRVRIATESLASAKLTEDKKTNKVVFMEYQADEEKGRKELFTPKKYLDEVIEADEENEMDLIVARRMAQKSNCSYIFGESSREVFFQDYQNGFRDYGEMIRAIYEFAAKDLFVIRNSHSGVITANFMLPMAFRIDHRTMNSSTADAIRGDFALSLTEPTMLAAKEKEILGSIVDEMNMVLYTIIPGMTLELKDYGVQTMDNGKEGYKVELMSVKQGMPPIPIRMESEGIIKIISILSVLIQAFGNESICLAIDELDAGIFEYMLGELLEIFQKAAKGQLIFTSHNLRALEMLDKDSIMFSTANPENRYIHMKNIKNSNNLRDVYLRTITLGGQNEVIYQDTDSLKIARAFRKAGRTTRGGN